MFNSRSHRVGVSGEVDVTHDRAGEQELTWRVQSVPSQGGGAAGLNPADTPIFVDFDTSEIDDAPAPVQQMAGNQLHCNYPE